MLSRDLRALLRQLQQCRLPEGTAVLSAATADMAEMLLSKCANRAGNLER